MDLKEGDTTVSINIKSLTKNFFPFVGYKIIENDNFTEIVCGCIRVDGIDDDYKNNL